MQNAVRVVIVLLDANRKVFVAVETRRLLKNRAQHIEMVREQTIFLRGLIQFSQSGNMVKEGRIALFGSQQIAAVGRVLVDHIAARLTQFIAEHIEKQGVVRGNHCLELGCPAA